MRGQFWKSVFLFGFIQAFLAAAAFASPTPEEKLAKAMTSKQLCTAWTELNPERWPIYSSPKWQLLFQRLRQLHGHKKLPLDFLTSCYGDFLMSSDAKGVLYFQPYPNDLVLVFLRTMSKVKIDRSSAYEIGRLVEYAELSAFTGEELRELKTTFLKESAKGGNFFGGPTVYPFILLDSVSPFTSDEVTKLMQVIPDTESSDINKNWWGISAAYLILNSEIGAMEPQRSYVLRALSSTSKITNYSGANPSPNHTTKELELNTVGRRNLTQIANSLTDQELGALIANFQNIFARDSVLLVQHGGSSNIYREQRLVFQQALNSSLRYRGALETFQNAHWEAGDRWNGHYGEIDFGLFSIYRQFFLNHGLSSQDIFQVGVDLKHDMRNEFAKIENKLDYLIALAKQGKISEFPTDAEYTLASRYWTRVGIYGAAILTPDQDTLDILLQPSLYAIDAIKALEQLKPLPEEFALQYAFSVGMLLNTTSASLFKLQVEQKTLMAMMQLLKEGVDKSVFEKGFAYLVWANRLSLYSSFDPVFGQFLIQLAPKKPTLTDANGACKATLSDPAKYCFYYTTPFKKMYERDAERLKNLGYTVPDVDLTGLQN